MLRKFRGVSFGIFFSSLVFVSSIAFYGCSDGGSDSSSPVTVSQPKQDGQGGNGKVEEKEKQGGNESSRTIKLSDAPVGYASVTAQTGTGTTVTTRAELLSAISKGGLIYIKGMIDMSDGMLPDEAGGSTTKLDEFVKTKDSTFSSYNDFYTKYTGACTETTNDKSSSSTTQSGESLYRKNLWTLNKAYQKIVCLELNDNTAIIGNDSSSGIKGGSIQINGKKNIIIRNLTIEDAYDPFPHHEKNDGFNAELDGICIQGNTENIWIDHCTLKDTMHCKITNVVNSKTGHDKWQTYDGLCDIKGNAKSVTVSYCRFVNHDKTMLIGSDDTENVTVTRQVTLHHNYFLNCGQRLPMVRITNVHVFNNFYDTDSDKYYDQQYAIGVRAKALIVAENNYFGNGISKAFNGSSNTEEVGDSKTNMVSDTKLYEAGNTNGKNSNSSYYTAVTEKPFTPSYTYTAESASDAKTSVLANAGAGCTLAD